MSYIPPFLSRLALDPSADERTVRRAYARELKMIDQDMDPVGFQSLREAYDAAVQWVRWQSDAKVPITAPDAELPKASASASPNYAQRPFKLKVGSTGVREAVVAPILAENADADAEAVFADFSRQFHIEQGKPEKQGAAQLQSELDRLLDDPRLVSIAARSIFEFHVGKLLANGWKPGHEVLLVVATKVFQWDKDRKRLDRFGQIGQVLNRAIIEREAYDRQTWGEQSKQKELIIRMRDAKLPNNDELVQQLPLIEALVARYPTWLALITNIDILKTWREKEKGLTPSQRKAGLQAMPNKADKSTSSWRWYHWILLVFLFHMIRTCTSGTW